MNIFFTPTSLMAYSNVLALRNIDPTKPDHDYLLKKRIPSPNNAENTIDYKYRPRPVGTVPVGSLFDILASLLQLVVTVPPKPTKETFFVPLVTLLLRWTAEFYSPAVKNPEVCQITWRGSTFYLGCSISGYRCDDFCPRQNKAFGLMKKVRAHRTGLLDMDIILAACTGDKAKLKEKDKQWFGYCGETIPFVQAKTDCPNGSPEWEYMAICFPNNPKKKNSESGESKPADGQEGGVNRESNKMRKNRELQERGQNLKNKQPEEKRVCDRCELLVTLYLDPQ